MAKARAILKRRKAVRNIKKMTKTMQMIATAKFQKSLKRAMATKPYTLKVRELVGNLARSLGEIQHPMLRTIDPAKSPKKAAVLVLSSDRGLCGGYNGAVIRYAVDTVRRLESEGNEVQLSVSGKKGQSYFSFSKRSFQRMQGFGDVPKREDVEKAAEKLIDEFVSGQVDSIHVVYMNFVSTGVQRPDTMMLLPLSGVMTALDRIAQDLAEKEAQIKAGALDAKRRGDDVRAETGVPNANEFRKVEYDFSPDARSLLEELLPLTVKTAFYQTALDAKTSEHVARMVAMKAATDNADEMGRALSMQYNRARQTQITTELSEIMGGVEAMSGK